MPPGPKRALAPDILPERFREHRAASYAADLLVVDGDLERDVTLLSQPVAVWVRGLRVTP